MAAFTIALAALAGAQFWAMWKQSEQMRDGQGQLREVMAQMRSLLGEVRDGLNETRRIADATASAASTARSALEISTRANVGIESILLVDPNPVGNRRIVDRAARSHIEITMKNYGATPARDIKLEFQASMLPYTEDPVSIGCSGKELHAQCTSKALFKPIHEMSSEFYKEADVNLFLHDLRVDGYIRYKDVFGNGYYVGVSAPFNETDYKFEITTTVKSEA